MISGSQLASSPFGTAILASTNGFTGFSGGKNSTSAVIGFGGSVISPQTNETLHVFQASSAFRSPFGGGDVGVNAWQQETTRFGNGNYQSSGVFGNANAPRGCGIGQPFFGCGSTTASSTGMFANSNASPFANAEKSQGGFMHSNPPFTNAFGNDNIHQKGGLGNSCFGASSESMFGNISGSSGASSSEGGGAVAMNIRPANMKATPKSEGQIYVETWNFLELSRKGGVWPFSSIGADNIEVPVFEGLPLSFNEHRWEFYKRGAMNGQAFHEETVQRLLILQRQFFQQVVEKAKLFNLRFNPELGPEVSPLYMQSQICKSSIELGNLNTSITNRLDFNMQEITVDKISNDSNTICIDSSSNVQLGNLMSSNPSQDRGIASDVGRCTGQLTENHISNEDWEAEAFRAAQFAPGKIPESPPAR